MDFLRIPYVTVKGDKLANHNRLLEYGIAGKTGLINDVRNLDSETTRGNVSVIDIELGHYPLAQATATAALSHFNMAFGSINPALRPVLPPVAKQSQPPKITFHLPPKPIHLAKPKAAFKLAARRVTGSAAHAHPAAKQHPVVRKFVKAVVRTRPVARRAKQVASRHHH